MHKLSTRQRLPWFLLHCSYSSPSVRVHSSFILEPTSGFPSRHHMFNALETSVLGALILGKQCHLGFTQLAENPKFYAWSPSVPCADYCRVRWAKVSSWQPQNQKLSHMISESNIVLKMKLMKEIYYEQNTKIQV